MIKELKLTNGEICNYFPYGIGHRLIPEQSLGEYTSCGMALTSYIFQIRDKYVIYMASFLVPQTKEGRSRLFSLFEKNSHCLN